MKVFLGWSGELSHKVALALRDWLPSVIQSVKPYVSSEDIAKGARWGSKIARELELSEFGIICVTKDNSNSTWINFEAGALSKEIEESYVIPFLFNLRQSEISGPLAQFQSATNDKEEIFKLVTSINGRQQAEQRLEAATLKKAFEMWWHQLNEALAKIEREESGKPSAKKPDQGAILEELLALARTQQRELEASGDLYSKVQREFFDRQMHRLEEVAGIVSTTARSVEALHGEINAFDNLSPLALEPPPGLRGIRGGARGGARAIGNLSMLGGAGSSARQAPQTATASGSWGGDGQLPPDLPAPPNPKKK